MAHWRCAVGFTQLCKPPGSVLLMYQQVESPTCNKSRLYQPLGGGSADLLDPQAKAWPSAPGTGKECPLAETLLGWAEGSSLQHSTAGAQSRKRIKY